MPDQGGFQSRSMTDAGRMEGLKAFQVEPAEKGTLEWMFSQTPQSVSFLNLRQPFPDELLVYFQSEVRSFNVGSAFNPAWRSNFTEINYYNRHFDGVIFVETTSRARPTEAVKGRMLVE